MKCGVGDYTSCLASALAKKQSVRIGVLTDVKAGPNIEQDSDIEFFPIARGWKISDIIPIINVIRQWKPDIIHIQFPSRGYTRRCLPWFLPIIFQLLKLNVVQTCHEYYPMGGRYCILIAIGSGGLIAVRPNYMGMMPSWYRFLLRKKRFIYIPNTSTIPAVQLSRKMKSEIRSRYIGTSEFLVAYFGFVYPVKGVELQFEIADPDIHHLLLISELNQNDAYHGKILNRMNSKLWQGKVSLTGFLPEEQVAQLLAAADAVLFPFRDGGGAWNTSIHAATAQGTFVLTTSKEKNGYLKSENVYYARPGDIADMRHGLHTYIGHKISYPSGTGNPTWDSIAESHVQFYRLLIGNGPGIE
jgi:glycosyltransferase involved in cell wall biosynthesis